MNLTTGTGKIAWQPQRLSAEAYTLSPADLPSETLPSTDKSLNVLEGMFPYGPIGVCRTGGTCVLSKMPAGWDGAPYPRLMRFKLQSEHGTGYVYSAIVKEVRKDGRRALINLMSVQDKYAQAAMISGGGLLTFPPLVSAQRYLTGRMRGFTPNLNILQKAIRFNFSFGLSVRLALNRMERRVIPRKASRVRIQELMGSFFFVPRMAERSSGRRLSSVCCCWSMSRRGGCFRKSQGREATGGTGTSSRSSRS